VAHALFHLARRPVGKGDAQDFARPGASGADNISKPRGQRRSLASARPSEHQHWTFGCQHSFALRRVQAFEIRVWDGFDGGLHM
jgi:hypothetical protein